MVTRRKEKVTRGERMHIPDGYLGPVTCAIFYIIAIAALYISFKKASRKLDAKEIPLLSLLSAFSFLSMMFNWPVPDGTTVHMVGAVLIAILLGPYAATIAVSIALLIQALMFGDGGITTYGANVFNMAIVMPYAGILVYKGIMRMAKGKENVQPIAAGIASYVGINLAALACGLELGIQPYINPGYFPYTFYLSVPAMLFAHLLIAGPVEFVVSFSVILYLQRVHPEYLKLPKLDFLGG
jgi:cobalt/nickel transport system permease protein